MPHAYMYNNTAVCWCGQDHPDPDGLTGSEKEDAARAHDAEPGYWQPMTEADLDGLYLEAWLADA